VLDAVDDRDRPVALVHEDTRPLRRMAIFDVVVNNTDRKGGHVLAMADGHRFGVDHGVCFHTDDKLRTVLWGWAGDPLSDEETGALAALESDLADGALRRTLEPLLTEREIDRTGVAVPATHRRGDAADPEWRLAIHPVAAVLRAGTSAASGRREAGRGAAAIPGTP
jgi:uncharacterized repeat protein (TIGR03843 family)